jgi:hypothetical protein
MLWVGYVREYGEEMAAAAVRKAGWNWDKLNMLSQSIRNGTFDERELEKIREKARRAKKRNYKRNVAALTEFTMRVTL